MDIFKSQINFFENNIPNSDNINLSISEGSVGWHIAHCCLVFVSIANVVSASNQAEYKPKFNWKKLLVLFTGKIPRGKAKAPDRVKPKEIVTKHSLLLQIEDVKQKLKLLDGLHKNTFFEHPYFGKLNLDETKKFLSIHNNHHSKIILDILK